MLRALHPEPGMIRGRLCAGLFSVIPGVVLSQLLTPCSNILIWFLRMDGKVCHPPSLEPRRQTIEEFKGLLGFARIESVSIYLVVESPGSVIDRQPKSSIGYYLCVLQQVRRALYPQGLVSEIILQHWYQISSLHT